MKRRAQRLAEAARLRQLRTDSAVFADSASFSVFVWFDESREIGSGTFTMWRRAVQMGCLLLVLSLVGCTGMFGRQGLPPDPLFANRKPIETKATTGPPTLPPSAEPAPAANPYFAERGLGPSVRD